MLLAVDIGNSTISTGLFGLDGELCFLASLDTDYRKTADQICVDLMNLFQLYHFHYEDVTDSILCSVVPPLNFMMEKALTRSEEHTSELQSHLSRLWWWAPA